MRGARLFAAALLAAALGAAGCGRGRKGPRVAAAAGPAGVQQQLAAGWTEEGLASWYGHPYHGRRTSSGEIYDMNQKTAAHRTLPFGARVLVRSLSNGRQVEVRINDRGPFVGDRVIDLSLAAAREIEMAGAGTDRVRLLVVSLAEGAPGGFFSVQAGSFRSRDNAERLRSSLAREHGVSFLRDHRSPRGVFHRVLVGRESEVAAAASLAEKLRAQGYSCLVVRVDEVPAGER